MEGVKRRSGSSELGLAGDGVRRSGEVVIGLVREGSRERLGVSELEGRVKSNINQKKK